MRKTGLFLAVGIIGFGVVNLASARAETRSVRETKGGGINFHLASATPLKGYEMVSMGGDGGALYVAPRPMWTGKEVVSQRTTGTRDGTVMELTISAEAAERLASQRKQQSGDRVAIYVDGKPALSGQLDSGSSGSRITITGLNSTNIEKVVQLINGERPVPAPLPAAAVISVVPAGEANGAYQVDVFVQGVSNLRTFQVTLQTSGGSSGELVREDLKIDKTRPDFVFADMEVISAADQVGGRLGGVLYDGGVENVAPGYLGTYTYRPSPDASGIFEVNVDTGPDSLLANAKNDMVEFRVGPPALISIGNEPTKVIIDK